MSRGRNVEDLTAGARSTFFYWREGVAVKAIMLKDRPRSYWRHKAQILDVLGIDISKSRAEQIDALNEVRFHGEYVIRRESSVGLDRAPDLTAARMA